jgi:hypothetical protein
MRLALSALLSFSALVSAPLSAPSAAPRGAAPAPAAGPAPAAPAAPSSRDAAATAADDCSRARAAGKPCVLTLGPEEVEGGVLVPDGQVLAAPLFTSAGSLIRLRRDFVPEILASAGEVD